MPLAMDNMFTNASMPIIYIMLEVLVGATAIVGNLLVIVIFGVERRLRKLTNFYILSLAASDFLVGMLAIPSAILTRAGYPKQNFSACLAMLTLLVVLCTVSILNLVAVSLDRYWAIIHPLAYHRLMSGRAAGAIIVACWILGCIIGFLPLMGWYNDTRYDKGCLFIPVISYDYLVFLYFATIVFPGFLMAIFYARIYAVVLKQLRQIAQFQQHQQRCHSEHRTATDSTAIPCNGHDNSSIPGTEAVVCNHISSPSPVRKREVKSAKSLAIIVFVFMICWLPLYTQNCIHAFCTGCQAPHWLVDCFIVLSHANSAINPFLYAYHLREFRMALRRLALRWKPERGGIELASVAAQVPTTIGNRVVGNEDLSSHSPRNLTPEHVPHSDSSCESEHRLTQHPSLQRIQPKQDTMITDVT